MWLISGICWRYGQTDYGKVRCTGLCIEEQDLGLAFRSSLSQIGMRGEFPEYGVSVI